MQIDHVTFICCLMLLVLSRASKRVISRHCALKMSSFTEKISTETPRIVVNAHDVVLRMKNAATEHGRVAENIKLVAVSKTKPHTDIQQLYDHGYRLFGENYYQELVDKAAILPKDIKWHFIGHLQSSKAAKLIKDVPNLAVLETVDSMKLALKLNNAVGAVGREYLDVYLQIDTSGEETKSGIPPEEAVSFVQEVNEKCKQLKIKGLMTIGAPGDISCFDKLVECRVNVANTLGVSIDSLELSMGMSGDFEAAISKGSTSIRVGSTIFGERDYSKP